MPRDVAGGLMTLGALRVQLSSLDKRLAALEGEAEKQTMILVTLARQDARLSHNPECHL